MKYAILISILAGLLVSSGATALAFVNETGSPIAATVAGEAMTESQAQMWEPDLFEPLAAPADLPDANPVAQTSLPFINGMNIRDANPTCGVPFTVDINVANQSPNVSSGGTVLLQNFHRGTGTINFSGSQGYPSQQPWTNYVVVFQVTINSYVSGGQELVASTNGSTFNLKYNLSPGNCLLPPGSAPPPPTPAPSANYTLQVAHSGKCLDVPGGSRNSIATMQQFSCTGADNQEWAVEPVGNGYFRLVSRFSGMCLNIAGFSQAAQALVQQFPCNGGDNQSFSFRHVSGDFNMIVARHSGMCLDVRGASTADLTPIQQFPCHGNSNQQWRLR